MELGNFTGATAYSFGIDAAIHMLSFKGTYDAAISEVYDAKLSMSLASKTKAATIIPEMTLKQLADIGSAMGGTVVENAGDKTVEFSIPVGINGKFNLLGGSATVTLSGCTAAAQYQFNQTDIVTVPTAAHIDITAAGCTSGAAKVLDTVNAMGLLVPAASIGEVRINKRGTSTTMKAQSVKEFARLVNTVAVLKSNAYPVCGWYEMIYLPIPQAVTCEVTLTANANVYLIKRG